MTEPVDYIARLRALADHLDPRIEHHLATAGDAPTATPAELRIIAGLLERIYAGGNPEAAAEQPEV